MTDLAVKLEGNTEALAAAIRDCDRRALAKGITLMESTRVDHRRLAHDLLTALFPYTGGAMRIGISGVPGVGKSTFIEALGNHIIKQSRRLAVLAIDPSSPVSGGSILGDKTRMQSLSANPAAFIRPSPAGGALGGVTRSTRETLLLCEAAGFDVVMIETVGVGQSEVAVAGMTDMFILLLLPGGGDELQGIKRGVLELADLVLINKADGELRSAAARSAADYQNALQFLKPRTRGWRVEVRQCSALTGSGIPEVWDTMTRHHAQLARDDRLNKRRGEQSRALMWEHTMTTLMTRLKKRPDVRERLTALEHEVTRQRLPESVAAAGIVDMLVDTIHGETSE